jgi:hypothetical protein
VHGIRDRGAREPAVAKDCLSSCGFGSETVDVWDVEVPGQKTVALFTFYQGARLRSGGTLLPLAGQLD